MLGSGYPNRQFASITNGRACFIEVGGAVNRIATPRAAQSYAGGVYVIRVIHGAQYYVHGGLRSRMLGECGEGMQYFLDRMTPDVARRVRLSRAAQRNRHAIQFGTRISKVHNVRNFGSNRAPNRRHAGSCTSVDATHA